MIVREWILRAYYATQHGPNILDVITQALDQTPSPPCPFCRERGFHRKRCYLARRAPNPGFKLPPSYKRDQ